MLGIHERQSNRLLLFQILTFLSCLLIMIAICYLFQISFLTSIFIVTVTVVMGCICLGSVILFLHKQNKQLTQAAFSLNQFINGNTQLRLFSYEEGSMAKFFEEVNHMALSLHTHFEKEKSSKEFLKNIISDISHQLKTPIAAIRMYNEIIANEAYNAETVEAFTQKTEKSLDRMECLIQNLLKIAKFDAGTILLEKRNFEVGELLEEIKESFLTKAKQEGKDIILSPNQEATLFADRDWTRESVINLLQNALCHMQVGDRVTLSYIETPVYLRIVVADTGNGIHPEDLHHIFKRFYRSRFSQNTQGVGLGLALVKSIMEAHGGSVSVESSLNTGSTFYLDFLKT